MFSKCSTENDHGNIESWPRMSENTGKHLSTGDSPEFEGSRKVISKVYFMVSAKTDLHTKWKTETDPTQSVSMKVTLEEPESEYRPLKSCGRSELKEPLRVSEALYENRHGISK